LDFVRAIPSTPVWLQAGYHLAPAAQIPAEQKNGLSLPRHTHTHTPAALQAASTVSGQAQALRPDNDTAQLTRILKGRLVCCLRQGEGKEAASPGVSLLGVMLAYTG
jgi:hypothetical protein